MATAIDNAAGEVREMPHQPSGSTSLKLTITVIRKNGKEITNVYRVRGIHPHANSGVVKAFDLSKLGSPEHYSVAVFNYGERGLCPECTCGDYVNRRESVDPQGCKHIRSLRAHGLI